MARMDGSDDFLVDEAAYEDVAELVLAVVIVVCALGAAERVFRVD